MEATIARIEALVTHHSALAGAILDFLEAVEVLESEAKSALALDAVSVERRLEDAGDRLVCSGLGQVLRAVDPKGDEVEVDGKRYRRVAQTSRGVYFGRRGRIEFGRHLFRQVGVRNGPTIVPLELRAGIVDGRWTPLAAAAAAHLLQDAPTRDAVSTCEALGVLRYSRSSLARIGEEIGARWEEHRFEGEDHLACTVEIPEEVRSLSVSVDRVSVPMAEPVFDADGAPVLTKKGWPHKEINFRMAYCGVVTLYDAQGEPLANARYGRMPHEGHDPLEASLVGDLDAVLASRPDLQVVGLADGAPEMQYMLKRILAAVACPEAPIRIDFWHLIEKLGAAVRAAGRKPSEFLPGFKKRLLQESHAIEHIEVRLRTWASDHTSEDVPEPLKEALTYIENNREGMRYHELVEANLPIGSGTVEATCKTLVSVRMKRSGAAWSPEGGQALLNLRSLAKSSRWNEAMNFLLPKYIVPVRDVAEAA